MYTRGLRGKVTAALSDTPVVLINGARQSGKTTLVQELAADRPNTVYRTLDDAATLAAAVADPVGFVRQPAELLIVDEVQHVPALFPAIKQEVDRNRRPGRFLLTGSANVLLLPKLSESLAGRMEILTLEPLAQTEVAGEGVNVLPGLFAAEGPAIPARHVTGDENLTGRIVAGGYPEALARGDPARRAAWFGAYLTAILQRDVRDLANIEGLTEMPRLLSLLATRTAGLLNVAELSRDAGIAHNTLKRYLALLQATFLIRLLPAWSRNPGKRFTKAPKLHVTDTGLASHLLGIDATRLAGHPTHWGRLVETFVVDEIMRQATWAPFLVQASHFRLATGQEVDLVLEDSRGRVVGVEVKAAATLRGEDLNGLKSLAALSGEAWAGGVVLYGGDTPLPFGPGLKAWPIASLWTRDRQSVPRQADARVAAKTPSGSGRSPTSG
ncbi:MAG: ATP-binding protein [Kiritimatiellae bacterium]|nr:ATP-binding protein [Kiritimatiellia bacterium]